MEKELNELKVLLEEETKLDDQIDVLKEKKDKLLQKLMPKIKADIFSTEFFTLSKDIKIDSKKSSAKALELYGETSIRLSKKKIKDAISLGIDVSSDVKYEEILSVKRKKNAIRGI